MEDFEVGTVVWQPLGSAIGIITPFRNIKVLCGVSTINSWEKYSNKMSPKLREDVRRLRSTWAKHEQEQQEMRKFLQEFFIKPFPKNSPLSKEQEKGRSDGSSADYYKLPEGCTQLQDLISHRNMNAQVGEIFRAMYRYGQASHSDQLRDAKKVKFYIEAEIARLEKLK